LGLAPEDLSARLAQLRHSAEQAGRDADSVELSLSGYLPTTTEQQVAEAESAGAVRLVVSASMTEDLAQVHDEMSAFAEGFGLPSVDESGDRVAGERARAGGP
jgi:alkanesulfonate monooxygenase SsuD/methylene tetrahydromethanopterin reductase-like flavin-dependent oxidoreductase (luciferase family)